MLEELERRDKEVRLHELVRAKTVWSGCVLSYESWEECNLLLDFQ